jgi:DNA replication protein DnaC
MNQDLQTQKPTRHQKLAADLEAYLTATPERRTEPCHEHPGYTCPINRERTLYYSRLSQPSSGPPHFHITYGECPLCVTERLHKSGVPASLLHCSLDNWAPSGDAEKQNAQIVRDYAGNPKGFLVMLGDVGTGKTHLAVGVMRAFRSSFRLVKQSTLLRMLRQTYRDDGAEDPISECQKTGLLVLDELGVSGGGRDEFPMLHELLDYRYSERKPTIITSNLAWEGLSQVLGERLVDRLKEATYRVLVFSGPSHRPERRADYLK